MNTPFLATVLASSAVFFAGCAGYSHTQTTTPAEPVDARLDAAPSLVDVTTGESVALSDLEGQYIALHFLLKTECPLCLRHTWDYHNRQGETPDVTQVFIKPDSVEEIQAWLGVSRENPPKIYQDADAGLAEHFAIPDGYQFHGESVHYPALIILGPERQEVFRYVGNRTQDRYGFDRYLATMETLRAE